MIVCSCPLRPSCLCAVFVLCPAFMVQQTNHFTVRSAIHTATHSTRNSTELSTNCNQKKRLTKRRNIRMNFCFVKIVALAVSGTVGLVNSAAAESRGIPPYQSLWTPIRHLLTRPEFRMEDPWNASPERRGKP
jgi:hypothetical protein